MKAFYTIIKVAPNTVTGDTVSIGLLLFQKNRFWLKFSDDKKNVSKRLINNNPEVVDFVVKKIILEIKKQNAECVKSDKSIFPLDRILNSQYFTYLNTYCNGVLQFSAPSLLNDTIDKDKFEKLFELLIDNSVPESNKAKNKISDTFYSAINKNLIKKVNKQVHTNVNITASFIPSMYFHYEMDCIGLNGQLIGAKSIPFDRQQQTLDRDISHFISLITLLSSQYKKDLSKNRFFVIADEPSSASSPEHKTYSEILKSPLFTVVPSEKSSEIADEVIKSKAKKFLGIKPKKTVKA
jgi:hypothetical protein